MRLLMLLAMTVLVGLTGCGDGGASAPPVDQGGPGGSRPVDDALASGRGTARFTVDLQTGEVDIRPLASRAAFAGSAVEFQPTTVLDQPGDTGRRMLRVTLVNHSGETLGVRADGGAGGRARLVLDELTTAAALTNDLRQQTRSETVAGTGTPGWADGPGLSAMMNVPFGAAAADDAWYVTDYTGSRIREWRGGRLSTLAGSGVTGGLDGFGPAARFSGPAGIAVDPVDGALIVAEDSGHRVRRVTRAGQVSTIAGSGTTGDADGNGTVARFRNPVGVAVGADGVIWVAEAGGHRVRRIVFTVGDRADAANWMVATIAGNGTAGYADGGGGSARFSSPAGIAVGPNELYVADRNNQRIRRLTFAGDTTTVAGTGTVGGANGGAAGATFSSPYGIAYHNGVLLVAEADGHRLRRIQPLVRGESPTLSSGWHVASLAGSSAADVDGSGFAARYNRPRLIGVDRAGLLGVPDSNNHKLKLVTAASGWFQDGLPNGQTSTQPVRLTNPDGLLSSGSGFGPRPFVNLDGPLAPGAEAEVEFEFSVPRGVGLFEFTVTVEADTSLEAPPPAATGGGSPEAVVTTIAGSDQGYTDGPGAQALFYSAQGVACAPDGSVYVSDYSANTIRRISPDGIVTTIAGRPFAGGGADGVGTAARFQSPYGLAWSPQGFLVVADAGNRKVRAVRNYSGPPESPTSWTVNTLAGTGSSGTATGLGSVAQFDLPSGVACDSVGNIFVTDSTTNRVVRLRPLQGPDSDQSGPTAWFAARLAGSPAGTNGYADGTGDAALFDSPTGIAVGPDGRVYVADYDNGRIRQLSAVGLGGGEVAVVSTLAGSGANGYLDGPGASAEFSYLVGLAVDRAGYVYVADYRRIRRIAPDGTVTTVAGTGVSLQGGGNGAVATFASLSMMAFAPSGDLYLTDYSTAIRKVQRLIQSAGG